MPWFGSNSFVMIDERCGEFATSHADESVNDKLGWGGA